MYKLLKHRPKLSGTISESSLPPRAESPAPMEFKPLPESKAVEELATQIEAELKKVVANQEETQTGLRGLAELLAKVCVSNSQLSAMSQCFACQKTMELEDVRAELNQTRVQKAMMKTLLNDVTQEKDILFDVSSPIKLGDPSTLRTMKAFNDELDTLYQSMQFPDDEGWRAMAEELRRAAEKAKAYERQKA